MATEDSLGVHQSIRGPQDEEIPQRLELLLSLTSLSAPASRHWFLGVAGPYCVLVHLWQLELRTLGLEGMYAGGFQSCRLENCSLHVIMSTFC